MAFRFSDIVEEARLSARALLEYGDHFFHPTVRLGVTGLSRAGKTVFITALIHGLTRGGRFPVFEPFATGRIARARLEPQPDDAVPRFDYENHVRTLIEQRHWPSSTVDISELRLVIDYQRRNGADRTLTLDIVDYPGEWLLDLPLLHKSYEQWSHESLALSREQPRARLAAPWHAHLATLNASGREDEQAALSAARLFTDYLRACRDERFAMSLLANPYLKLIGGALLLWIGVKLIAENGKLTAASASQICDGASGVMVVNEKGLKALGIKPMARIHHMTMMGGDPVIMLDAPLHATERALKKAGMSVDDIDLFEVNEAFASVPTAWLKTTGADPAKLNVNGGAIALGHPLGGSGTKLMTTLVNALKQRNKRYGLQTMCEGGGMANVTIVERL